MSKYEGLWLGRDKNKQTNCRLFGIKLPEQIRCLGICTGHSGDKDIQKNWFDKIAKVEEILESYKIRKLSLFGKAQIIKTFVISQFALPAPLLVVPDGVVKQIESLVYKFLWRSRDKIKRFKLYMM